MITQHLTTGAFTRLWLEVVTPALLYVYLDDQAAGQHEAHDESDLGAMLWIGGIGVARQHTSVRMSGV